jgi:hypothetical protein
MDMPRGRRQDAQRYGRLGLPEPPVKVLDVLAPTAEATTGSGLSDLYPGLTGGVQFPTLPNPYNLLPVPIFTLAFR